MTPVRILITGGGTGGHVSPALAVIETIRRWAKTPAATFAPEFLYLGSDAGIEAKLAREAGIPFAAIATGKLRRSSKGLLGLITPENLRDALRVPVGIGESVAAVRRFKPDLVLATGGYVSVPPVIAAGMSGVPVLIHEQTVTVGLANKIAGRFARRIALSFPEALTELPASLRSKAVVTGNPVRQVIFGGIADSAVARYGLASDLPCVYVTGGAQGSRIINRAVESVLPDLLQICRIVHQCGKQPEGTEQDYDRLTAAKAGLAPELSDRYHVTPYITSEEIADLYALSDVILGRSGAGTVTEVCALGKPSIFIPLQPASGDEQMKNARRLAENGAAIIVSQSECDGVIILHRIRELIMDAAKMRQMAQAALRLSTPDAAVDLATELFRMEYPAFTPPDHKHV